MRYLKVRSFVKWPLLCYCVIKWRLLLLVHVYSVSIRLMMFPTYYRPHENCISHSFVLLTWYSWFANSPCKSFTCSSPALLIFFSSSMYCSICLMALFKRSFIFSLLINVSLMSLTLYFFVVFSYGLHTVWVLSYKITLFQMTLSILQINMEWSDIFVNNGTEFWCSVVASVIALSLKSFTYWICL